MRKNRIFGMLSATALLFAGACSHDDLVNSGSGNGTSPGRDGVFMSIALNPSGNAGTRSQTNGNNSSTDGVEIGTDAENAVNTALIILTDRENKIIASSFVDPSSNTKVSITTGTTGSNPTYTALAQFDRTAFADYYDTFEGKTEEEKQKIGQIRVFVICNPTDYMVTRFDDNELAGTTEWTNLAFDVTDPDEIGKIWDSAKGFVMTNELIANREIPKTIDAWEAYADPTTAFNLSGMNGDAGSTTNPLIDNLSNGGSVKVHRMAARFDFRDGSQAGVEGSNGIPGQAFTYAVIENEDHKTIVDCKILAMGLTNMSKTEYYFGRVSDNGLLTGTNYTLCGYETNSNFVVSTNAADKAAFENKIIDGNKYADYFQYPFFNPEGQVFDKGESWDWIDVNDVVKSEDKGGIKDNYKDKNYYVWRYLTENTIPGPATNQVNCLSTGVIFKARMLATDILNTGDKYEKMLYDALTYDEANVGELLHHNTDLDPILYSLVTEKKIYVSWENIREAALAEAGFNTEKKPEEQTLNRYAPLFKICYGENGGVGIVKYTTKAGTEYTYNDKTIAGFDQNPNSLNSLWQKWEDLRSADPTASNVATQEARSAFKAEATRLGFALYQSSQDQFTGDWGYYCYYYYWNRHNDNLRNHVMRNMEFAVVRNNVYKLMVTKLSNLGHPRIPENDPDPNKPDTPDESSDAYITVSVEVLPWVVRINNIEF